MHTYIYIYENIHSFTKRKVRARKTMNLSKTSDSAKNKNSQQLIKSHKFPQIQPLALSA